MNCHSLVAGWMADIHPLIDDDVPPRLPQLLPTLNLATPDGSLMLSGIAAAVASDKNVLEALASERPHC